jgi:hypothetical protein
VNTMIFGYVGNLFIREGGAASYKLQAASRSLSVI